MPEIVAVRWMIRRDMPVVLKIENDSFDFPWSEDDFIGAIRQRNCIGMVAEHAEQVIGFMIYELHKSSLHILNFAVCPRWRREGVGRQMIERLTWKLSQQRRTEIMALVRETNLPAQLFFKATGFRAGTVVRNHWADSNEDAYVFRYQIGDESGFRPEDAGWAAQCFGGLA